VPQAQTPTPNAQPTPEAVPYHRFQEVNEQLKANRTELSAAMAQIRAMEAQMQSHIAEVTTLREATARGLTDPEGLEIARTLWGAQPAEGRKPFGQWLDAAISGEKPVRALTAYLPPPAGQTAGTPAAQAPKPPAAPMPPKVPAQTPAGAAPEPTPGFAQVRAGDQAARAAVAKLFNNG